MTHKWMALCGVLLAGVTVAVFAVGCGGGGGGDGDGGPTDALFDEMEGEAANLKSVTCPCVPDAALRRECERADDSVPGCLRSVTRAYFDAHPEEQSAILGNLNCQIDVAAEAHQCAAAQECDLSGVESCLLDALDQLDNCPPVPAELEDDLYQRCEGELVSADGGSASGTDSDGSLTGLVRGIVANVASGL